jgi:hypothetical protein
VNSPKINARTLAAAAAAGITDLHADGPGRYIVPGKTPNGGVLIIRQGSGWHLLSPIAGSRFPRTLPVAFQLAADLVDQEAEMTARAKALTDDEIAQTLANRSGVEYHYLQRVIAERCHREYVASKAA